MNLGSAKIRLSQQNVKLFLKCLYKIQRILIQFSNICIVLIFLHLKMQKLAANVYKIQSKWTLKLRFINQGHNNCCKVCLFAKIIAMNFQLCYQIHADGGNVNVFKWEFIDSSVFVMKNRWEGLSRGDRFCCNSSSSTISMLYLLSCRSMATIYVGDCNIIHWLSSDLL